MEKTCEHLKAWALSLDVQDLFDLSTSQELSGTQRSIAYNIAKKLRAGGIHSYKQLKALDGSITACATQLLRKKIVIKET